MSSSASASTGHPNSASKLHLRLDGFEGPLDLLLELSRARKIDIATISATSLVDQLLEAIVEMRNVRLENAADWLVMAAWFAWLKSRLLLPPEQAEGEDAESVVEDLASRLLELEQMRAAARWLSNRAQLGWDTFGRGASEDMVLENRTDILADLAGLLAAHLNTRGRSLGKRIYRPKPRKLWTVQDALQRLSLTMGGIPTWAVLQHFLPDGFADPVERRAAIASTLIAGLELAKNGELELKQDTPFGPIMIRPASRNDDSLEPEAQSA